MKVLYVLPQIYPFYVGGAEIFHYHLLKEVSKVREVGYIGYDDIKQQKISFYKLYKIKPWKLAIPLQTIYYIIKLRKKYNILHLNYSQSSWVHWFYYPLLKLIFNVQYGITIHDSSEKAWNGRKIFKCVFDNANFIVAVSESIKSDYENRCRQNIIYLPPLIPLKPYFIGSGTLRKQLGIDPSFRVLLFVGSLKELKRPMVVIDALNIVGKDWIIRHSLKFVIAGDGPLKNTIKERVLFYGLDNIVILAGNIPNEKVNELYDFSSYYIIPSKREGTSLSLIEAMYNKLGIIASNVQGINQMIYHKKNGLLFELDDANSLANCIKLLVENPELSIELGLKAYSDYVVKFRFETMFKQYIDLYSI